MTSDLAVYVSTCEHIADIVWRFGLCVHRHYHARKWVPRYGNKTSGRPSLTYRAAVIVPVMCKRGDLLSYLIAPNTIMLSWWAVCWSRTKARSNRLSPYMGMSIFNTQIFAGFFTKLVVPLVTLVRIAVAPCQISSVMACSQCNDCQECRCTSCNVQFTI